MPIIKSATKKMKQDKRRYAQNLRTKRSLRTAVQAFEVKPTFDTLREAQSKLDTAVKKHVLTKQAAARRMSHLSAAAKTAGVKIAKVAKKPAAKVAPKVVAKTVAKTTATKPATKTAAKKPVAKTAVKKATAKK